MPAEAILRSTCDRCGAVHETSYSKNIANHTPAGWDRWSLSGREAVLICGECNLQVRDLITKPLTHVGWAAASGSGLSFTGLASTAERDGYTTRVYVLGASVARRRKPGTNDAG